MESPESGKPSGPASMEWISRHRLLVASCCLIVIAASLVTVCGNLFGRSGCPVVEVDPCAGEIIGQEVALLLHGNGNLLVFSLAGGPLKSPVSEGHMKGLREGFRPFPNVKISAVLAPPQALKMEFFEGLPKEFFLESVQAHPEADAIVSFLGLPNFSAETMKEYSGKLPILVALHLPGKVQWVHLVESEIATGVVVARPDVQWDKLKQTSDCRTRFDQRYLMVTRSNVKQTIKKHKAFRSELKSTESGSTPKQPGR